MTRWIVYGYGKYFTESIMWQLTGKLYPFSSDKKAIIAPIFSRLYHSLACFQQTLKTQSAQWRNLHHVRLSFLTWVHSRCQQCRSDDTNWSTQVGAHFLLEEKLGEVCREVTIITSNISAASSDTQGVTCLDYCICHVTLVTRDTGHYRDYSLRWLLISGSQLSELCW